MRRSSTWYGNFIVHRCSCTESPARIQDWTLTDSIAAVEAAWSRVAREIGADPAFVIASTHGKRAIDNLALFKPQLLPHEMDAGPSFSSVFASASGVRSCDSNLDSDPNPCSTAGTVICLCHLWCWAPQRRGNSSLLCIVS